MRVIVAMLALLWLFGCTSIEVREVDPALEVSHVCIKNNPDVIVSDFLPVVRRGFERHGITTEVYEADKPSYCDYHLTYTALKTWDIGMYMHHAELQLYQEVNPVAYAEYHLVGKGGLSLTKWASVEEKMDPVIDELLAGYTPEMVDEFRDDIPDSHAVSDSNENDKSYQLRQLRAWYDEGLITEEEYNREKDKVLNQ